MLITREYAYKQAFENKKNSLKKRRNEYDMLLNSVYISYPELKDIENQLSSVGARLAITALSGDTQKMEMLKAESALLAEKKEKILKKSKLKPFKFECDVCRDTGYVQGKICSCIKSEAEKIIVEELSKEMPLGECSFENFDLKFYSDKSDKGSENPKRRMTAILKVCTEYVINFEKERKNLLFFGNAGLGKTHLTLAIVSGIIKKGYLPIYGSAENLLNAIEKEKFSGEGKGTYDSLLSCDLLVIDDLGAELTTSFTKSVLYNLINTRMLSGKPTIINTNLSMKEIEQRYTARVSSRLIGNYEWHKFLGEDIRQQKILGRD